MSTEVLLFGLGAIGSVYACMLASSEGCEVSVCARSNYQVVKDEGMTMKSDILGDKGPLKFKGVYKTPKEAAESGSKFSYILCANKALLDAKPSLAEQLAPAVGPETAIVLLQNGVGAEDPLHQAFPNNTIITCVVWTGGRFVTPNVIQHFNSERLQIGVDYTSSIDKKVEDARLDKLVLLLRAAGGTCEVHADIQSQRWIKVIWNACWNSVTCCTLQRTHTFLASSPQAIPLARTIMSEVIQVAKAKGLTIPDDTIDVLMDRCMSVKTGLPSSMLFDNIAGNPMEVEVILGTPMREGLRLGVPVPTLTAIYCIVKALDFKNAHPEECQI